MTVSWLSAKTSDALSTAVTLPNLFVTSSIRTCAICPYLSSVGD